MAKTDYSTKRNKAPNHMYSMPKTHYINHKLDSPDIDRLVKRVHLFNDFESSFYISLRNSNYLVLTEKQMSIVRKLMSKNIKVAPVDENKPSVEKTKLTDEQIEILSTGLKEGGIKWSKKERSILDSVKKYHYICTTNQKFYIDKMIKQVIDFYDSF